MMIMEETSGLLYASVCNNCLASRDLWNNRGNFDSRKSLQKEYQCFYSEIKTTTIKLQYNKIYNKIAINIERTAHMIDNIDLVTSDVSNIKSIEVQIGGLQIDKFDCADLKTQINTLCQLYGNYRRVTNNFIPLELFPFHSNNIYSPLLLQHHDTRIIITFYNEIQECKLYGNMYFMEDRYNLFKMNYVLTYGIQSYSYPNLIIKKGINTYKLDSHSYCNPSSLLYFWGFDKSKVKNIKLQLASHRYYYDGPIANLEYRTQTLGYTCEPVVIHFTTEKLTEYSRGNVNLCYMEKTQLIIETDQETESNFYLVNIGARGLVYKDGMIDFTIQN